MPTPPASSEAEEQRGAAASSSTSSVMQTSLNLIKNIAGFGALCLPAGIERLSDSGLSSNEALGLGVALLLLFGILNAWSFLLIGAACVQTETDTYSAAVTATVGPQLARLVMLSCIFICATAAVGCQVVISATLTDVLAFALHTPFEVRCPPRARGCNPCAPMLRPSASQLQLERCRSAVRRYKRYPYSSPRYPDCRPVHPGCAKHASVAVCAHRVCVYPGAAPPRPAATRGGAGAAAALPAALAQAARARLALRRPRHRCHRAVHRRALARRLVRP